MTHIKHSKLLILFLVIIIAQLSRAQSCGTCAVHVTTINASSYTVSTGQTFCVDSTGIFTGTLTLNGGTLCNRGLFKPGSFTFTSGDFNNYSKVGIAGNYTLATGSSIYCEIKAGMRIIGNFTVSGGTFTNNGVANITSNISYTSGSFVNSGIMSCHIFTGLTEVTNTGKINHD